jgi:hypothetical protein
MALSRRAACRFLTTATVVGGGVLIAGCGGSSHGTVSIVKAADLSTSAAGFKMDITETGTVAGASVNATGGGVWDAKDHAGSVQMTMSIDGQTVPLEAIYTKDTFYEKLPTQGSKLPAGKPWLSFNLNELAKIAKLPSMGSLTNSDSTGNPSVYLQYLKAAGKSVQNLGQQTVEGVQTTHYRANLDLAQLPGTVPASERSAAQQLATALKDKYNASVSPVDVWVDQAGLVRQIQMTYSETVEGHSFSLTVTAQYTSYGPQPAPTVPSASETTDIASLVKNSGG